MELQQLNLPIITIPWRMKKHPIQDMVEDIVNAIAASGLKLEGIADHYQRSKYQGTELADTPYVPSFETQEIAQNEAYNQKNVKKEAIDRLRGHSKREGKGTQRRQDRSAMGQLSREKEEFQTLRSLFKKLQRNS